MRKIGTTMRQHRIIRKVWTVGSSLRLSIPWRVVGENRLYVSKKAWIWVTDSGRLYLDMSRTEEAPLAIRAQMVANCWSFEVKIDVMKTSRWFAIPRFVRDTVHLSEGEWIEWRQISSTLWQLILIRRLKDEDF